MQLPLCASVGGRHVADAVLGHGRSLTERLPRATVLETDDTDDPW